MNHYKLVEVLSNLNVKPPRHEGKAPPRKRKAPLTDEFLATVLYRQCLLSETYQAHCIPPNWGSRCHRCPKFSSVTT